MSGVLIVEELKTIYQQSQVASALGVTGQKKGRKMTKQDLIKIVCERLICEHQSLKVFMAGLGKAETCYCPGCVAARKILDMGKTITKPKKQLRKGKNDKEKI